MKPTKLELEIRKIACLGCEDCKRTPILSADCRVSKTAHKIYKMIARKMKKFEKEDATYSKYRTIREGANRAYGFLKNYGESNENV